MLEEKDAAGNFDENTEKVIVESKKEPGLDEDEQSHIDFNHDQSQIEEEPSKEESKADAA